ncbi:MAG TPA: hypothetical protein PLV32_06890 [Chitinophagaceae bacterium]|nr:hypothetical protein [Chitinophagaceae bacterium]
MNFTHPAHQEMIFSLIDNHVDFILVGGYAVIYHGYVRTTGDMDLWVRPTNESKTRLLGVLTKLQFDPDGIKEIDKMDFTQPAVFHIGEEPERIEFMSKVDGLNFSEAWPRRQFLNVKKYQIPFLHLDDLIANKSIANPSKDKADIEYLLKINTRK